MAFTLSLTPLHHDKIPEDYPLCHGGDASFLERRNYQYR
eukprot:CAMPEP_0172724872 /NCGR_PEP_ID=MMETSP1074-20121228/87065_1 /TAXON_ID=2916 /ORGANISM="Ceratium fusus, Strain PA161109" /LENGTH=38 /DNA_ID= /DNA_START= /DNA_END= /DNA_ORIENTATION=